jgi:hypothetical protein
MSTTCLVCCLGRYCFFLRKFAGLLEFDGFSFCSQPGRADPDVLRSEGQVAARATVDL